MKNYLEFIEVNNSGKKTKIFDVRNNITGWRLGQIKWFPAWRKYCYLIDSATWFDSNCLQEIVLFLNKLNKKS